MNFFIITPSLNQLPYLKWCLASVRDQAPGCNAAGGCSLMVDTDSSTTQRSDNAATQHAIRVHHHIQDGGSMDGTVEFLTEDAAKQPSTGNYQLTFASEADEGMYDALNKGVSFALQKQIPDNWQPVAANCDDEIVAWLNCDEQYLEGTLQKVAHFFKTHPKADFVYGDVLFVNSSGRLLTYRKNPPLRKAYVLADHLYTQSAGIFFRTRVFKSGLHFDTAWKAVGDFDFMIHVLNAGFRPQQIKDYMAACTITGENLSSRQDGVNELRAFRRTVPSYYRLAQPGWNALRYLEKFLRGGYQQAVPLEYALYSEDSNVRKKLTAQKADFRFKWDVNA